MSNEMKLLMALCDALGFEVEMTATQNNRIGANQDVIKEYALTKKEAMVPMPVNSDAWSGIVQYVNNHTGDIEAGINDFDTLRPALDFFNRNSK